MTDTHTLILGLGSTVLSDDGIGVHVVEHLMLDGLPEKVSAVAAGTAGMGILDLLTTCDRLIMVDAIDVGAEPGQIMELSLSDLEDMTPLHAASSHEADLPATLALAEKLDLRIPESIRIVAIQIADVTTFGETCTPLVEPAIRRAADLIRQRVASCSPMGIADRGFRR